MAVEFNVNNLSRNLETAAVVATEIVDTVLERNAAEAQNDMRMNAPWTDRTGNARQGLFASSYVQGDEHGIVCYHTVPYGIYLETANSGAYRIIMPVVLRTGRKVMADLRALTRSL